MRSEDANEFRCSKCGRFVACETGPAGYDDYLQELPHHPKGPAMTEKHPGYTSHGHPIPGACGIAGQRPTYVVRCGGPRLCDTCSWEAERYNESRPDSNEPPTMTDRTPSTEEHATVAETREARTLSGADVGREVAIEKHGDQRFIICAVSHTMASTYITGPWEAVWMLHSGDLVTVRDVGFLTGDQGGGMVGL